MFTSSTIGSYPHEDVTHKALTHYFCDEDNELFVINKCLHGNTPSPLTSTDVYMEALNHLSTYACKHSYQKLMAYDMMSWT